MPSFNIRINKIKEEIILFFSFLLSSVVSFIFFDSNKFYLAFPLIVLASLGAYVLISLIKRERGIEIFDAGAILIAITFLYCFFPLLSYALNGFENTIFVDNRFKEHSMNPIKMGNHSWNHIIYFFSLSFGYLYTRPKRKTVAFRDQLLKKTDNSEIFLGFFLLAMISAYQIIIPILFGETFPYFIKQLNNASSALFFVMSIWFFTICLVKDNALFKILLFFYVIFEFYKLIFGLSGRTWFFLHLLSLVILYHRIVNPISVKKLSIYFPLLFIFFLAIGYARTSQLGILNVAGFFTGNEEFTSLFATSYDVKMILSNEVSSTQVPLSILWYDFIGLIPSQFLPFEKIDPASWYIRITGYEGEGVGFGFGAISQAMLGFGKIDLFIRGAITGIFYGYLHKILNREQTSIWAIVIYVYLAIMSYQTFRAGTGYPFYFIIYYALPCFLYLKFFYLSSKKRHQQNFEIYEK